MKVPNLLVAVLFCSLMSQALRAESTELMFPELPFEQYELPLPPSDNSISLQEDVIAEPEWFKTQPAPTERLWSFQVDLIPTTGVLTDGRFGFRTEDPVLASRVTVGYERPTGFGARAQIWSFSQEVRTHFGKIETDATTLYLDAYQQQCMGALELAFGGGFAAAHMDFQSDTYIGAGVSAFGDAFYPIRRFSKSDLGIIGNARLALLVSLEDDVLHHWGTTIDELAWGFQLRRRFGRAQDKFWNIDLVREFQHWGVVSEPFVSDEVFRGTAFKFGIGW